MGCGLKFSPLNKSTRLCNICIKKKENGECTICGVLHFPVQRGDVNEFGHCLSCTEEQLKYSMYDERERECKICSEQIENVTSNLCNSCLTKQDTCPHCSENTKYLSEYSCNACKVKYMKAGKNYKLPL